VYENNASGADRRDVIQKGGMLTEGREVEGIYDTLIFIGDL